MTSATNSSNGLTPFLGRRAYLVLFAAYIVFIGSLWRDMSAASQSLMRDNSLKQARAYSRTSTYLRDLYSENGIEPANMPFHYGITEDVTAHSTPDADADSSGQFNIENDRIQVRLYSDYPFPWKKNLREADSFENEAMAAIRKIPRTEFFRFEERDGQTVLRYASAELMRANCLHCHNNHPDSPKHDWRDGDVSGVLAVSIPVANLPHVAESRLHSTTMLSTFMAIVSFLVVILSIHRIRRAGFALKESNDRLENTNGQLAIRERELTHLLSSVEDQNNELVLAKTAADRRARELEKAQRATLSMMNDIEVARQHADASTKAKSEFLANMSHEIRTPMTAILGFADVVVERCEDPESVDAASIIKRNGEHLLGIINDILDLSKIESGKLEAESIDCSPVQILADVVSLMRVKASAKGIQLNLSIDGKIPERIQSDPTRLRQILINLVGNSIKFTELGSVNLSAKLLDPNSTNPLMQFTVRDTGIGMTEQQLKHIFRDFSQADSSITRQFGGTGLGLSICQRLTRLLGGDITVESAPGKGSVFAVTITTGRLDGVSFLENHSESQPSLGDAEDREVMASAGKPLSGKRILLVEDGPDNQRLISFVLRKSGAAVEIAENGQTAIEIIDAQENQHGFDVILMDMQMPVLDGYSATRKLRNQGFRGMIIALTAHAMSSDHQKCIDAGCNDFATKPINRDYLITMIQAHCQPGTNNIELELATTE